MSMIESNDILRNICSHAYYRGDEIFRAIQCLAEGKTITRIWTLEDSGKTVIDEKLKDRLMKSKDKGNAFDDVNWAWLLSLLLFLSTLEPPKRREITISAKSNSKSVTIAYDPSDAEAVKAAEVWREALFVASPAAGTKPTFCDCYLRKVENPEPGKTYFRMSFEQSGFDRLSPVVYLGNDKFHDCAGDFDGCAKSDYWEFVPIDPSNAEAVKTAKQKAYSRYAQHEFGEALKFEEQNCRDFQRYANDSPGADRMKALRKVAEPLRDYLKAHGAPHTSVIVTRDGATETQDERRVTFDSEKTDGTAKHEPAVDSLLGYEPLIGSNIDFEDKIGYLWEESSSVRGYALRWREHPGGDANRVCNLYYDGVDGHYHTKTVCEGNEDISPENGIIHAFGMKQAMKEVERRVQERLSEDAKHSKKRLDAWRPANMTAPKTD